MFCKLVEHVPGRRIRNPQCRFCNANSDNPKEQHPVTNAIDGTNQWWQSPSIKNGRQFHWVTITLDLRQVFQVAYIIIKAANSPRPGNWILERSLDGVNFDPWQYYAISDSECLTRYNITPRLGPPTYKRDDEVICTSYYSKLVPLEHGEIHTSLINGRPSADDLTPELLDFTSARYIRLRLQRIRTLNADLMTLSYRDPKDVDPIVTRRYFYSIKDISVGGMCICYGHAQSCPWDPVTKKLQCVCEHNTCGESCNECCPGYHQEPWQPGTISDGNTCEKCNCHNKAHDCYYNQTVADLKQSINTHGHHQGGGVCINCSQNTAGVNCETCAHGYYRPHQVSPYTISPCVECQCDQRGSESAACIRDDIQGEKTGLSPGQCVCREGFAGKRCERCAFGFRDFPLCVRCECNLAGSLNTDPCTTCICKSNVMGVHCDLCKPGSYNLQSSDPDGCRQCFCFGVSDVCESSAWSTSQTVHINGWLLPSQSLSVYPAPVAHDNDLITPSNASSGHTYQQVLSWVAPESFLGNRLVSYGGYLNFSVFYDVPLDNQDRTLPAHCDIIIEGNDRMLRQAPPHLLFLSPLAEQSVSVAMVPQGFVDVHTGVHVSPEDLLSVLAAVSSLRVRVHLNSSASGPLRLGKVSLDMADPNAANRRQAVAVEMCECPWGYAGTSCESCMAGFYRVGGVLFGGNCMQCDCNEHATECDINGVCISCTHNTTGPHCDQCLSGFYGDATEGTPDDCQRCSCPLTQNSNNFSPTCVLEDSGKVSCDQCQDGYTGTRCERCADGFHGDPGVLGGACVRCECNGNVNVSEAGHCDYVTGACLRCLGNTGGIHCDICQTGYYGDAIHAKNCRECGCNAHGALSSLCDVTTGQCDCRANVVGDTCDRCQAGFYGIQSGHGCEACNCSQSGSLSESCDEEGRCQCVVGVAGDKCDRCNHGYYNYSDNRCTACNCAHTHGNCNQTTGECICPPHTEGEECERCESNFWGHDPITGCQSCDCSPAGSSSPQCDLTNGQCLCQPGFSGRSCDQCELGYHGYPECTVCGCDLAGTKEEFCNQTLGVCDCEETGECVCKASVGGRGCEECVLGAFGLWGWNPEGCSPCFCSGLSSVCDELGGMVRVPITLGSSPDLLAVVSQSDLQGVVTGVYQQGGDMLLDTREFNTNKLAGPLYWRLPKQYQGNKLLSYGGVLSYDVVFYAEDGSGLANQEPQVLMRGGTLRKLVIYTDMVAPSNGIRTHHTISLTEYKWRYFNSVSEKAVSHADFMSVLSHVHYIIIKASYGTRLQQTRISNITMETAVEAEEEEGPGGSEVRGGMARLIESCLCPPGYAGLSCQECSPGFYRQSVLGVRGSSLYVQPCVPCSCNNHTHTCDMETGDCLSCQHHTTGRRCDLCSPGYYGNVTGSINDCSLCACPLKDNSFSPTCVLEGVFGDFRCTACQPGYEGRYCERCSVGYYGNPSSVGGLCERCSCSSWGSLHGVCDAVSGQCECKAGVRGQLCDHCDGRYVLEEGQCVSCDDECSGVLLDDLVTIHNNFLSVNLTAVVMAPFSLLAALENQTKDIQATRLSAELEEVGVSTNQSLTQGALLLESINSLLDNSVHLSTVALVGSVEVVMDQNQELLAEALSLAEDLSNVTAQVEGYSGQTEQWSPLLRRQVDSLVMGLKRTDALDNVYRAESHAHNLHRHAHTLHSSLSAVCNISHNTSSAVQTNRSIRADTLTALDMASLAHSTAAHALDMTVQSEQPLAIKGSEAVNMSVTVLEHSQDLLNMTDGLRLNVSEVTARLGLVRDSVRNASRLLPQPISKLHSLSNGSSVVVQEVRHQTAVAQSNLQRAMERLEEVRAHLEHSSSVVEQANETVKSTNSLVMASHTTANEAQRKLEEAERRTERLMDRMKPLSILGETLGRNLSDIRELINQARKQAASIKVAVQAERDCVRSYRPEVRSSNFNTLSLTFRTSHHDNLLFYMGSKTTLDYLALQMHDGKVSLLWDVGSGSGRLESPLDLTNNRWTRINATRFGAHGSLSVQQMESDSGLLPVVTAWSPGPARILDIDNNTVIYIGGLGGQTRKPSALSVFSFQGCMGEASLNEKNIGLWNYYHREGECRGCFTSPQVEETSFHFDGSGYSVVEKSLRSTTTFIVLLFKTLSPNGLLLYLASNGTRDFLSMELVEGCVHLTFDLGSGPLTLTSTRKYNTGIWNKITLQRNKRKGYLSIMAADQSSEKEVLEAESPGTASDLNRSDLDPIYIGGLPASRPIRRQVVSRSYVGCIKNVEIARSNFDLLRDAYGVKKGCILEAVRSVSVLRGGFVQLPVLSLSQQGELLLSFSTRNNSGLLLAAFNKDTPRTRRQNTQSFLVVQLVSGQVEAELNLGGGASHRVVVKPWTGTFSDGMEHSVIITRNRKTLSVQVDEDHVESTPLSSGGLSPLSLSSVFIGGLPTGEEPILPIKLQNTARAFRGCIQNLVVDKMLIDLSGAMRYEGVELDSCLLEERASGALLPDDQEVEPTPDPAQPPVAPTQLSALTPGTLTCVSEEEPSFLPSANQFGLSRHSHMTFSINPNTVRKSFSVKMSVRTHAENGLVYYMANVNQMDYAILQLVGGRMVFTVDLGKGPASASSSHTVNDGQWHTVHTELIRRSVSVSVDGASSLPVSVRGNQLDVQNTLYLGGLPHTHTTKRIGNVSSSLPGCVQAFSVNNMRLDKPSSQHNTASCFTNTQTGSYFNGSGYAALMREGFKVGSDMSVSLEFRTSQSDAVLLGISSAKVDAIGLEILNGQVAFHVNNGAGRVSVLSGSGLWVCDGHWHHLVARKTKHSLSVSVDGQTSMTQNPYPQSTSAETNNPVYLGGYSDGVKQNCLSTRSWFRGCMRNLKLVKGHVTEALDLSSAFFRSGVTPNSCPAA
ncbi:laminin subunit alpha-1 [Polymixia lowei]